ncbi:MAG: SUMF1/EgtB/PvdO family nonheme iron enzyme [Deltaproteobacteria bacterium]
MADVFLSYARADLEIAQRVVGYLEGVGYSVFLDTRLQAGEYFDEKIEAELETCACVVVLWTERSVKRRWVRVEAREGAEREILVPVSVQGARPPLEFRGIQTLAMDEASEGVLEALWGAVSRHVAPLSGAGVEPDAVAQHGAEVPHSAGWAFDETTDGFGRCADVRIGDVGFRMRWIEAGTFRMGSTPEDGDAYDKELPQHVVTLSEGFWIAEAPCEQRLWEAVMGSNPSKFKGGRRPVEQVSWDDVQAFLAATPAELGLRLPTEAEWEYAGRAGSTAPRYGELDAIAWYRENAGAATHAVKQKQPNAWGLYDMLGNVLEWCVDGADGIAGDPYPAGPRADPVAPSGDRPYRVMRGGSWSGVAWSVRAAFRFAYLRDDRRGGVGFRLARGRA